MTVHLAVMDFSDALRTLELIGNSSLDMVMLVQTDRGGDVPSESARDFGDSRPRHSIAGYYMGAGQHADASSSRRRYYSAVRVVRNIDAATPSLLSAFKSNDNMEIELSTYKAGGDSSPSALPHFKMILKGAKVKTYTLLSGGALPNAGCFEIIELVFRNIKIEAAPQSSTGQRGAVNTFNDELSEAGA
jgi:type VI protein secretion system component Hcp